MPLYCVSRIDQPERQGGIVTSDRGPAPGLRPDSVTPAQDQYSDYTFPCNNCRALVGAIIRTEACQPDEIVSAPDSLAYTQRNIFDKFYQYFSLCCGLGQVNSTCLLLILLLDMVFLDVLQNLHCDWFVFLYGKRDEKITLIHVFRQGEFKFSTSTLIYFWGLNT